METDTAPPLPVSLTISLPRRLAPIQTKQMLAPVLQMDVWLDPAYVCALYESCKGTNAVAQVIF